MSNTGINRQPLVREPGNNNTMANAAGFASAVSDRHIPVSVVPSNGGITDIYYIPVGGVGSIESFGGFDVNQLDMNTTFLIQAFYTYDNTIGKGGFIYSAKGQFLAFVQSALGQYISELKAGEKYIVDTAFLRNAKIANNSTGYEIAIQLTQLNPF